MYGRNFSWTSSKGEIKGAIRLLTWEDSWDSELRQACGAKTTLESEYSLPYVFKSQSQQIWSEVLVFKITLSIH